MCLVPFRSIRLLALSAGCLIGCGGDDDPSAVEANADVSVSELGSEEAEAVCNEWSRDAETALPATRRLEVSCTFGGIFSGSTAECTSMRDACVAAGGDEDSPFDVPSTADIVDATDCRDGAGIATSCAATVAAIDACFGELTTRIGGLLDAISCEAAGNVQAMQELQMQAATFEGGLESIEPCQPVLAECPNLFDE